MLLLAPAPSMAEVRLFYSWLSDHPSTLRTRLGGNTPLDPGRFEVFHRSRHEDWFTVEWKRDPSVAACSLVPDLAILDSAANAMLQVAGLRDVRRALRHKKIAVEVSFVPEGYSFESRNAIFRRGSGQATVAAGVHVACDDITAWPALAAVKIVHELTHMRIHGRDLHLVNDEAMAYTAQACTWLDVSGRMPSTLVVAQKLPPILLELFHTDSAADFLAVRFRNEPGTSLRGGVLSQLNLGLFLGTSPIESTSDPRSGSARDYCACVENTLPDFLAYKPGELWRDSNGTTCSVSDPATAPRTAR